MTSYIYYYGLNPLHIYICILLWDYIIATIDVNVILLCHCTGLLMSDVMPL